MSIKTALRKAFASQAEIEADEERTEALQVGCTALDQLPARSHVTVTGILRSVTLRPRADVPALEAELYDGSGSITLLWLGRREIAGIEPGRRLKLEGRVTEVDGRRTIFNPRYELRPQTGE